MQNKDRYHLSIDVMRVVAILAVVCIHATSRVLEVSSGSVFAFFLNQVSRFAVPLFFMISGFVLEINYPFHQSYLTYLKKRFSRILLPYLFWSAMYYFFVYKQHTISLFQAMLDGSASYQLYFIPALLIFYILFPFLHKLYRFIANRWVLFLLGVLQIVLLAKDYYHHPLPFFYPVSIAFLNYFVFILGMVAAHHHKILFQYINKWKWLFLSLLGLLSIFVFMEGRIFYLKTHNYLFFYSQWRPSVLLYSLVVFGVLYGLSNRLEKHDVVIRGLSRLSFFVYFIHVVVLEFVWNIIGKTLFFTTSKLPTQQFWYVPLFFSSVVAVSFLVAFLVRKIPYMARVSG